MREILYQAKSDIKSQSESVQMKMYNTLFADFIVLTTLKVTFAQTIEGSTVISQ